MEGFLSRFSAVSAPQVPWQPSDTPSVILINKPMNRYLLGDLEADTEDSSLEGTLHWGHFPWPHNPRSPTPEFRTEKGDVLCRVCGHLMVFIACHGPAEGRGWCQCGDETILSRDSASPVGGTSQGGFYFLLLVSNPVFKNYDDSEPSQ